MTPGRLLHAELAVVDGSQVMIVAYLCITVLVFVLINLVVALLYAVIDPRIRPAT